MILIGFLIKDLKRHFEISIICGAFSEIIILHTTLCVFTGVFDQDIFDKHFFLADNRK